MLKVMLRENSNPSARTKYVFRSSNEGQLTFEKLVSEMAQYNTTMTSADVKGVMDVFKAVVLKYLLLGYRVKTPLGLFYVTAAGTTDDKTADFTPKLKSIDHQLNVRFFVDTDVSSSVLADTQWERGTNRFKMLPYIDTVVNAVDETAETYTAGDTVRIIGEYLKFEKDDERQGVFLKQGDVETRLTDYAWNLPKRIEVRLPGELTAGSYTLIVRAKPSTQVRETNWENPLVISA